MAIVKGHTPHAFIEAGQEREVQSKGDGFMYSMRRLAHGSLKKR